MADKPLFTFHSEPEPEPKLTESEKLHEMATKRVEFLINQLGPSADVLDMQSRELNGLSLRETLLERELKKLVDKAEAKRQRQKLAEDARLARDTEATQDIDENWGEHYIITINGQRVKRLKKLETPCPFCPAALVERAVQDDQRSPEKGSLGVHSPGSVHTRPREERDAEGLQRIGAGWDNGKDTDRHGKDVWQGFQFQPSHHAEDPGKDVEEERATNREHPAGPGA